MIGAINGLLITRLKMNNFIVTLAMQLVLRGIAYVISMGAIMPGTPALFNWLGGGRVGIIPISVVFTVVLFALFDYILRNTRFGRQLYAVGGNREAARASGINPERRIRQVYLIAALLAALAGWMLSARITTVPPNLADGMVFEVMAASVIGGVSLNGGRGTMMGAFGGVLLLSAIGAGLNLIDVNAFWVDAIRGFIILFAMGIDAQKVRYRAPVVKSAVITPAAPTSPGSMTGD